MLPRKAADGARMQTVPETDTGGQVEQTKALERTIGEGTLQITTVTSGEGGLLGVKGLAPQAPKSRREMAVATVYQKLSTLPTRKRMYRV